MNHATDDMKISGVYRIVSIRRSIIMRLPEKHTAEFY